MRKFSAPYFNDLVPISVKKLYPSHKTQGKKGEHCKICVGAHLVLTHYTRDQRCARTTLSACTESNAPHTGEKVEEGRGLRRDTVAQDKRKKGLHSPSVISWVTVSIATPAGGGPIAAELVEACISCITALPCRRTDTATAALFASSSIGRRRILRRQRVTCRARQTPLATIRPANRSSAFGACFDHFFLSAPVRRRQTPMPSSSRVRTCRG